MITQPLTVRELKELFTETFLDTQQTVTKVSDNSVLSGVAYGVAKLAQKTMKELALVESHVFPDQAFGQYLDTIAADRGVPARFGPTVSSGYVRLVASPGTQYSLGVNQFFARNGLIFDLEEDVLIGANGYAYAKVRSQLAAAAADVEPLSITRVVPTPDGHQYVINEYQMQGGRDAETDSEFRTRIRDSVNILASGTLAKLTQVMLTTNQTVLRLFNQGLASNGKQRLAVASSNGIDYTTSELQALLTTIEPFLAVRDLRTYSGNTVGLELVNVSWLPVDVSLRGELENGANPVTVRTEMQIRMGKYLDPRNWRAHQKVEWDELLTIARSTPGMRYVYDNFFFPQADITVPTSRIPRIRGFSLLNAVGALLTTNGDTLNPIYYPPIVDDVFVRSLA